MNAKSTLLLVLAFDFFLLPWSLIAQQDGPKKEIVIIPMKFPQQNLHPDTMIDNEAVAYLDTTKMHLNLGSLLPGIQGTEVIPGNPGIMGLDPSFMGSSDRAFGTLMLEQNPELYPASANVRLISVYPESPPGWYYQCSGALIDAKHILTAGHCVPKADEGGWAETIDVYAAYNEGENEFIGTAKMVNLLSWDGWTQNGLYDHDMAIIELDRPVGALAGSLGYGTSFHNAADQYHTFGYPGAAPYDGQLMYDRQGTFDYAIPYILGHPNYSYGGQSGSSSMDMDFITYSCLSHGTDPPNPPNTGHTRIAGTKFSNIQQFISNNTPGSVDLVAMRATASPTFISTGSWLDYFNFVLHNYSSADFAGTLNVQYYLSEDDYITSSDELLGTATYTISGLTEKSTQWVTNNIALYIPDHIAPGDYYLGVHVTNWDYYSLNNYTDYQDALPVYIYCGQPEAPSLSYVGDIELCTWEVFELYASTTCASCDIEWSNGETGSMIYVTEPGEYYAVARNDCGNASWTSESLFVEILEVPDPPEVEISGPLNPCEGDEITLTATGICPGCSVYWSNGEWGESTTVYTEGTYVATLSNYCGESDGTWIDIFFAEEPSAPLITAQGETSLCTGQSVTLIAQEVCPTCVVEWSNGASGVSILVTTPGTYKAWVMNDCGSSTMSNSIVVTVGSAPTAPVVSAEGSTILCPGGSATLMATNVCNGCTVNWSNGLTGMAVTVTNEGTYTATVMNPCGVSTASNAITITSMPLPEPVTISTSDPTEICGIGSVTIMASPTCSSCVLEWSNGETSQQITVSAAGQYTTTVMNACGLSLPSNTITVTYSDVFVPVIQINDTCRLAAPAGDQYQWSVDGVDIPNATTRFWTALVEGYYIVRMVSTTGCPGESDALYALECMATSIRDFESVHLRLFPNPANNRIYVELQSPGVLQQVSMNLYTMDGAFVTTLLRADVLSDGIVQDIEIGHLSAGTYFYSLHSTEGVWQGKLVVMR